LHDEEVALKLTIAPPYKQRGVLQKRGVGIMEEQMASLILKRETLLGQIAIIVAKGDTANAAEIALLKAYRRMLQSTNAQIVILQNTPEEPEPEPE
jgi:hypothetical protein